MSLILLHGLGQTSESWDGVVQAMGYDDVYLPDFHELLGDNPVTFDTVYRAFEVYCADIEGALDICGLSLGGMIALRYAIENPARVRSLTLIGAQYKIPKVLFALQAWVMSWMPARSFASMGFTKPEILSLLNSMTDLNLQAGLSEVQCPTLVLCGEKDRVNRRASRELASAISQARYEHIPGAKHEANIDQPAALAVLICDMLADLDENPVH